MSPFLLQHPKVCDRIHHMNTITATLSILTLVLLYGASAQKRFWCSIDCFHKHFVISVRGLCRIGTILSATSLLIVSAI